MSTLRDILPDVYTRLLPDVFDREAIEETRATCDDCAMCTPTPGGAPTGILFRPDVKCCSYHPKLPNYLVGAVLADARLDEGKRRMREKIARRYGITPQWISAPQKFTVTFEGARRSSFGRSTALICPYFDAGRCTVWQHRESVCATFFCRYVGGAYGQRLWRAVRDYLTHVERRLAAHALETLAPSLVEPRFLRGEMSLDDLEDRPPNDETYAGWWGAWLGREEELYVASERVVRELSRDAYDRLVHDDEGRELLGSIAARYAAATRPTLAERLVLNPEMTSLRFSGGVAVTAYNIYDPMFLADPLYEVLEKLRPDETVEDALVRLDRDHDLQVDRGLLLSLQMQEVLVEPPAAK